MGIEIVAVRFLVAKPAVGSLGGFGKTGGEMCAMAPSVMRDTIQ